MARMNSTEQGRLFIGVDPGQSGGIAIVNANGELGLHFAMPETRKGIADVLCQFFFSKADVVAVVEAVHSMPKQGVASTFKFGKGYGAILGICAAYGFKLLEPTPQAWKKLMLVGTDKSKDASIQVCENLFPDVQLVLPRCRKPHDGIAEAVLLAEYGRRTYGK